MSASDRRLAKLFNVVTLIVAAVVALGIFSFVVALILMHVGGGSQGLTTVTTVP
jgi:F0F1-type ATP synthase membrane subunit c/vacuolar-type H+-ATPase subunit K